MPLGALPIRGEILRPSRGPHTPLALPGREVWTGFCGFCIGIIWALIIYDGFVNSPKFVIPANAGIQNILK
jgi:hypothetical protein